MQEIEAHFIPTKLCTGYLINSILFSAMLLKLKLNHLAFCAISAIGMRLRCDCQNLELKECGAKPVVHSGERSVC